ncbi:11227_t:CDS:2 [Funneliformis mosseae]|uniref:11227_t:CDS:1 n=1 Tax=Funneliformis mosseae TaxID=27381 RepID=A0A9N8YYX5_FUNMO|nr:11227_t:CDS:2 [Funneliformis mosseae]
MTRDFVCEKAKIEGRQRGQSIIEIDKIESPKMYGISTWERSGYTNYTMGLRSDHCSLVTETHTITGTCPNGRHIGIRASPNIKQKNTERPFETTLQKRY